MLCIIPDHSYALGINDGLVGWWKFNEGSGGIASDSSGNGNTGTVTGPTWVAGKIGRALSFGGVVDTSLSSVFLPSANIPFSVTFWFNASSISATTTNNRIFSCFVPGSSVFFVSLGSSSKVQVWAGSSVDSATDVVINKYYHVAVVYTGTQFYLYIDGVLDGNFPVTKAVGGGGAVNARIGAFADGSRPYSGILDDIRFYNRAITASEVSMLAQNRNQIKNAQINNGQVK